MSEQVAKWRQEHPEQAALQGIRQGAKERGLRCTITMKNLPKVPKFCPVFPWIKLRWHKNEGISRTHQLDSPSLDRIRNGRGYVPGNVRWVSWRANSLKSDASLRELKALLRDAKWIAKVQSTRR
jgi:hypothetical protein